MTEPISARETREELEACLREHDRERAVGAILAAVEGGLPIEELYADVLVPFLASVGQAWREGRVAVWEEHLSVGAVRTAIEALYPTVLRRKAQVEAVPMTVAFFCPPEETHDIGLRMLVDRFDLAGFRTVYVGALTPVAQMIECARSVGADVICLSASTHYQRATLFDVVKTVSRELPHVRIVAGGPAFARSGGGWEEYLVDSVDQLIGGLIAKAADAGGSARRRRRGLPAGGETRMLELRIARRFLWRSKSQSILIILGIAVGIAVQVFVGSLITSLQDSLIESTVGSSSHVTLGPADGEAVFTFTAADRERVRSNPLVTAVAPVQVLSVLVPVGESSAPLVVKAGDYADLDSIYKLSDRIVSGEASLQGDRILVGQAFAEKFKLGPGDAVKLVLADGSSIDGQIEGCVRPRLPSGQHADRVRGHGGRRGPRSPGGPGGRRGDTDQ